MTDHSHVDGNALGGLLMDMFGREMTHQPGRCGGCGAVSPMGALHVYMRAPGIVVRCPACSSVLIVITTIDSSTRLTFASLEWIEMGAEAGQS